MHGAPRRRRGVRRRGRDGGRGVASVERLRAAALGKGLPADLVERALHGLSPDHEITDRVASQAEHVEPPGAYVSRRVSRERIAAGHAWLGVLRKELGAIERAYGVEAAVLAAIWGIESNYGERRGDRSVIRSLATLAHADRRRAAFWTGELISALSIAAAGEIALADMRGSWAGAMGHTQLMPSTYLAKAVDFDGDGRRDVLESPADALASAAAHLKASGWRHGVAWGAEVRLPSGPGLADPGTGGRRLLPAWRAVGVELADPSQDVTRLAGPLQLLLPQGLAGPAFLVTANFEALLRYNNAMAYAIAVGHLADRIAGAGPLAQAWPLAQRAMTRDERIELQLRLMAFGHDTGGIDGILGNRSREAVRLFQLSQALPADGYPSLDVLDRLRLTEIYEP